MTHTKEPWGICYYDAGDCDYYDHNGPCPSIQAPDDEDCAIVHWDGFKQKYWSSANGNQRQIEANARRIVDCVNALAGIPDPAAYVAAMGIVLQALEGVIDATCSYLPPDGISKDECINRILQASDNKHVFQALTAARTAQGNT